MFSTESGNLVFFPCLFSFHFLDVVEWAAAFVRWWVVEGATEPIPQSEVLAVVTRVVQVMVRVMSCSIDQRLQQQRNLEVAVVDWHRPDIDGNIQRQVQHLVQREHKRVDVVRHALHEAVDWVKRVTGVRRRHFPRMMWLVDCSVDNTVM